MPSTGTPNRLSMSDGRRITWSSISSMKASMAPRAAPANPAISILCKGLGLEGAPGGKARSITEMLLVDSPPATPISL